MALNIKVIKIPLADKAVTVKISADRYPQAITGVVWRYLEDKTPDGKAGRFNFEIPEVPLGSPEFVNKKLFLVQGVVLAQNDNPPTPYQVVVTVLQGDKDLSEEVPEDSGEGFIGSEDIPFIYRFSLEV